MSAPSGTLVVYSTAPGDVAAVGKGANSPYSQALARAMRITGVPVEQVFKQVRISVRKDTKQAQTPWESSSLTGNFLFLPSAPLRLPVCHPRARHLLLWRDRRHLERHLRLRIKPWN
jgi:hypothetical protein